MDYIYEGALERIDGDWFAAVPQLAGVYGGGATVQEACQNAAEALKLAIAETVGDGGEPPVPVLSDSPQLVLCVEVDSTYIEETAPPRAK